jgi:mRNA interferase MazF
MPRPAARSGRRRNVAVVPDRGDVIWVDFAPSTGHEQGGRRAAFVLSPAAYNGNVGLALCCPVTSRVKRYPFEVALPPGFAIDGVVLADQVRTLDWRSRGATVAARAPRGVYVAVRALLDVLL